MHYALCPMQQVAVKDVAATHPQCTGAGENPLVFSRNSGLASLKVSPGSRSVPCSAMARPFYPLADAR